MVDKDAAGLDVNVGEIKQQEVFAPKYILKLGAPVTHRWVDKEGQKQSRTYDVGTKLGVIFPFKTRARNQKWVDCVTPDGIMLTIGHNRKHELITIDNIVENDGTVFDAETSEFVKLPIDNQSE